MDAKARHFRFVPLPNIAMPVEEPPTASKAEVPGEGPLSPFRADRLA